MERLIMEFSIGDGYTYSADITYPILYSSKEEAIYDFELMIQEKIEKLSDLDKEREKLYKEYQKIKDSINSIQSNKRMSKKEQEKNLQKLMKEANQLFKMQIYPLDEKIKEVKNIEFGGQILKLEDFVYLKEDEKLKYILPTLYTLNEYFEKVEENLSQKQKLKI
jgi:hypothetical protein